MQPNAPGRQSQLPELRLLLRRLGLRLFLRLLELRFRLELRLRLEFLRRLRFLLGLFRRLELLRRLRLLLLRLRFLPLPSLGAPHFMQSVLRAKLWKPHAGQSQSPARNSMAGFGLGGSRRRLPLRDPERPRERSRERPPEVERRTQLAASALFLPPVGSLISKAILSPLLSPEFLAL